EYPFHFVVDSVYFMDGKKIIEFSNQIEYYHHGLIKLKFIEGIGPNWGLFYGFNYSNNLLLCSYKNNLQTFIITEESDCYYWWVGDVWPDYPISNEAGRRNDLIKILHYESGILIKSQSDHPFNVAVYDLSGRLQMANKNVQHEIAIDLQKSQIYLIRLTIKEKTLFRKVLFY
ncbi:MAG: T9SS type A sorting domain-containing protein, partial [Bacteroidota bacterium]